MHFLQQKSCPLFGETRTRWPQQRQKLCRSSHLDEHILLMVTQLRDFVVRGRSSFTQQLVARRSFLILGKPHQEIDPASRILLLHAHCSVFEPALCLWAPQPRSLCNHYRCVCVRASVYPGDLPSGGQFSQPFLCSEFDVGHIPAKQGVTLPLLVRHPFSNGQKCQVTRAKSASFLLAKLSWWNRKDFWRGLLVRFRRGAALWKCVSSQCCQRNLCMNPRFPLTSAP